MVFWFKPHNLIPLVWFVVPVVALSQFHDGMKVVNSQKCGGVFVLEAVYG